MELFKKNPQRTVFWIGFLIVIVLLIVFTVYTCISLYNKPETNEEAKKETSAVQLFPSDEEIAKATAVFSVTGKVTKKTDTEITIAAEKENVTLKITKDSKITKGTSAAPTTLSKLSGGTTVTAAYDSDTDELINLWWSK